MSLHYFSLVNPDRKCPDVNKCEQLCVLSNTNNNSSSIETCYCLSGYVLDSNDMNCTGKT